MRYLFMIFLLISNINFLNSQTSYANDCISAMQVCSPNVNISANQLNSFGNVVEDFNPITTCFATNMKGVWLRIRINESGLFGFNIIPSNPNHDVDFVVLKMNNITCDQLHNVPNNYAIACNYSSNTEPTAVTGCNNDPNFQNSPMVQVNENDILYMFIGILTTLNLGPVQVDFSIGTCGIDYECSSFYGYAFVDQDENCIRNNNEVYIENINVCLENEGNLFCSTTNSNGEYLIEIPNSLNLSLTTPFNGGFYEFNCPNNQTFNFTNENSTIQGPDIPVKVNEYCKYLKLSTTTGIKRPCNSDYRYFTVTNLGSLNVDSTYLYLSYNDTLIVPFFFNQPYIDLDNNNFVIKLYNIEPGTHQTVQIFEQISCNAMIGDTICVDSWLDNYYGCDNAENVTGYILSEYIQDGNERRFKVSNLTTSALNINSSLYHNSEFDYISLGYVFSHLEPNQNVDLIVNEEIDDLEYYLQAFIFQTANTIYFNNKISINQTQSQPIFNNIICSEIRSSYDPNEMFGVYSGVGDDNLINNKLDLKYRINFQNTGNDTAFIVKVKHKFSEYLEKSTFIPGNSSHSYHFQIIENEIVFTFNNILLVDSLTNEPGSHGFVEFFIKQKTNNPEIYSIESFADIYFDFNSPITTSTHVYNIEPINELNLYHIDNKFDAKIIPNPAIDQIKIISKYQFDKVNLIISDIQGRKLKEISNYEFNNEINLAFLSSGFYYLSIYLDKKLEDCLKFTKF